MSWPVTGTKRARSNEASEEGDDEKGEEDAAAPFKEEHDDESVEEEEGGAAAAIVPFAQKPPLLLGLLRLWRPLSIGMSPLRGPAFSFEGWRPCPSSNCACLGMTSRNWPTPLLHHGARVRRAAWATAG